MKFKSKKVADTKDSHLEKYRVHIPYTINEMRNKHGLKSIPDGDTKLVTKE